MTEESRYTTQLGAGLGMISETMEILRLWNPGMDVHSLTQAVISQGVLSRATARRTRNIVIEMFAPRFLCDGGRPAAQIRQLLISRFPHESIVQLFFLQTARAQAVFRDFLVHVYWPKYSGGAVYIVREDAEPFIHRALDSGRMIKRWSSEMIERVSQYLVGCCVDFGLLAVGNRVQRPIQHFSAKADVSLYLAHDLHFSGVSDAAIIKHHDWLLFGFEPGEVLNRLKSLSREAIGERSQPSRKEPTYVGTALDWLEEARLTPAEEENLPPRTQLSTRRSKSQLRFETMDTQIQAQIHLSILAQ